MITLEQIISRVEVAEDGCWLWTGSRDAEGYGRICVDGITHRIARLVLTLSTGRDLGTLLACHTCDNPPCCNPEHLYAGTHSDNTKDAISRGRWVNPTTRGSAHPFAKLTEAAVIDIRRRRSAGEKLVALAAEYGISRSRLSEIVCHPDRNWPDADIPQFQIPESART